MSSSPNKRQRTHPTYTLLYHAEIPGRGEFIRLALEAAGAPYRDAANDPVEPSPKEVYKSCSADSTGLDNGNPPSRCPPMLRVDGEGRDGNSELLLDQTANILLYLGPRLGLAGEDGDADGGEGVDRYFVNGLTLTALDVNDEVHETHHPIASGLYYEDQKDEALNRAKDFRENRLPLFLGYFERVLLGNEERRGGQGKFLVGGRLTCADLTFWQVLDGLRFAFPIELKAREDEYPTIFTKFYPGIKEEKNVKEYLASSRRLKYSNGVFRHYPELDRESQEEK